MTKTGSTQPTAATALAAETPVAPAGPGAPLESAPKPALKAAILTASPGRPGIRWFTLVLIGAPIALLLLGGWYMTTRSTMARQREKMQLPEKALLQYPNQPELAFGFYRRVLDDPKSSTAIKAEAHAAIQNLIDAHGLSGRIEDLVADLLHRGENDFTQARAYAASLVYLDEHFKTKETVDAGKDRVARIEAIRSGYADAINDKVARSQIEKAIEKLSALNAQYPEADFVRPTIAEMQVEMADAMISLDMLEGAVGRLEIALKLDPLPLYKSKLNMLKSDIEKLDPTPYLVKARAAEASGDRAEAQTQYEAALRNRRSNQEAKDGYMRILKFYAEIFLRNVEEGDGVLSEQGEKFCKMAANNGKLLTQYGDDSLILAKAEMMLAENDFLDENVKSAKELADTAMKSIAVRQRSTMDGSYLMAKGFKLYYHLGKYMNKAPEAKQALYLADQYCRMAMDKDHPLASHLFVQLQNLEQAELDNTVQLQESYVTAPVDTASHSGDVRNIVNEGPLNDSAPTDNLQEDATPRLKPPESGYEGPIEPAPAPTGAPVQSAPTGAPVQSAPPPGHNADLDKLINPLH